MSVQRNIKYYNYLSKLKYNNLIFILGHQLDAVIEGLLIIQTLQCTNKFIKSLHATKKQSDFNLFT